MYLQYTKMILVKFDNFLNCFLNTLIFVTLGDIFFPTFFNNINIIISCSLKDCASSLLPVITLFSSIRVIKNSLFVKNALMKVQKILFVVMLLFVKKFHFYKEIANSILHVDPPKMQAIITHNTVFARY